MITDALEQTNSWQYQLNNLITDLDELADLVRLPRAILSDEASRQFPLRLPRAVLAKIQPGDINDPILRQYLPQAQEMQPVQGYSKDPLAEQAANPLPGLIDKYHGRVLITAAGHCAVNCRYCFRRHFDYSNNRLNEAQFTTIVDYVESDATIKEVIFSGGDPLVVSNRQLQHWFDRLSGIEHLERIRLHSRVPVVIPERVDSGLLQCFSQAQQQVVLVIHSNHPREIDHQLAESLGKLKQAGVHLLNQSVLLKGVNDSADTQIELCNALFKAGVLPYYLHLLDSVVGAADFFVSLSQAKALHQAMLAALPGYLVPKLVKEIAEESSKTWVN